MLCVICVLQKGESVICTFSFTECI